MTPLTFNDFFSRETMFDPIAFYVRLREQEPLTLFTFSGMNLWIIATSYDEAIATLKDPRLVKDIRTLYPERDPKQLQTFGGETIQLLSQNMLGADPPDHTRLRGLVSKAFTPRMIEQLRSRIQQITDELLDAVQGQGKMDLVMDFAYPLPMTVISEMLGIPVADRAQFRVLTQTLLNAFGSTGQEASIVSAGETFISYIRTLLANKREHPGNDLISDLLRVEEQGDTLSENELISTVWLLIVAGHETTVNLIGNGILTLLLHPDQMHLLQQQQSLISSAIEELLRYTAPVLFLGARWAREDIPMHGKVIRKGDVVRVSTVAANMDPREFSNPEALDITRQENPHLAFGKGIHYCLGAPLARLEGQVAIGTLLRRLPNLRLAVEPENLSWNPIPNLRSLTSLPVTF